MKGLYWVWLISAMGLLVWVLKPADNALRVPERFATIQAALTQAQAGDLIKVNASKGPYQGPISIKIPGVRLMSIGGRARVHTEGTEPVVSVMAPGVTLRGFQIQGRGTGVTLESVQNAVLVDNVIRGNTGIGVFAFGGQGHLIAGNTIENNLHGVWLSTNARGNEVRQNVIAHNAGLGVVLGNAMQNTVSDNRIESNAFGGVQLLGGGQNQVTDNQIKDNKPVGLMLSDFTRDNTIQANTLNDNPLGIRLLNASDNLLFNNTLRNHQGDGIWLEGAAGNTLCANTIRDNHTGIRITNASRNHLLNNTIQNNQVGLLVLGLSQGNGVNDNNFLFNHKAGLINQAAERLEATHNFWGDANGPTTGDNPGAGDALEGVVHSAPWHEHRIPTVVCDRSYRN